MTNTHSTSSNYPQYITRGGDTAFEPPYSLKETKLYGFVLEGTWENLQNLCDKYLNIPGQDQFKYRPAASRLLMVFDTIANISSTEPPASNKGFFSETGEVMFWVLTEAGKQEGAKFVVDHHAWFIPYIFVDSTPAMVLGREAYGFPKELGKFQIPEDPRTPQQLTLETLVLQPFNPQSETTWRQIINVQNERVEKGEFTLKHWADFKQVFEEISSLFVDIKIDDKCPTHLEVPMVFLKQFRDVRDGDKACYQAIVEATATLEKFHEGFPYLRQKFQVSIENFDSHPIVTELGLKLTQTAQLAFWLHFDFSFANGTEIWKAS
ncbi:acetoacetate decarboxylase family protein [Microcoleus sp. herbarium19]|uniref:acetoacetate decarboxylase family protein n=1 Tax=unclassified Microcoleus TaxID=2642155 RepID=UPI002FCEBD47